MYKKPAYSKCYYDVIEKKIRNFKNIRKNVKRVSYFRKLFFFTLYR